MLNAGLISCNVISRKSRFVFQIRNNLICIIYRPSQSALTFSRNKQMRHALGSGEKRDVLLAVWRLDEKVDNEMQSETAALTDLIGRNILDRIAYVFSRLIGVSCVVEHFLGDDASALSKPVDC